MTRVFLTAAIVIAVAAPARAANRDIERLQVQVAGLQTQIAELQRLGEENLKEVRRLNEFLAEQNAAFRKSLQDQKIQDEALATTIKEVAEKLAEISERAQAARVSAPDPGAPAPGSTFGAPITSPGSPATAPAGPPPAPRELYSQAYADYARGNYDLAIQGFSEYIRQFPSTDFTDNAQYWVGESLYGKKLFAEAIEGWNTLFRDYPSSDKLPDARVKKGMALERLGRRSQALVEYRYVIDRFPNSPAARIARERLNP
ncbi:MAG TPA: tol-pal system protein YbgF [Vicinamibacteria bacterium]